MSAAAPGEAGSPSPGAGGRPGPGARATREQLRGPGPPPALRARGAGPGRGGGGAQAVGMGVTPSFRRCPVTARPRPRPQAGTPRPRAAHLSAAEHPRLPHHHPLPSAPRQNPDPRSPGRRRASRHPSPRPALPGFPGSQRRGVPADGERPGAARRGRDGGGAAPAGSLGPRTHLSFSAGALAALRGVSSAAGQGHAPDVSTQATQGWVPAEVGGARRLVQAKRLEAGPEFIPPPRLWLVTAHAPTSKVC